MTFDAPLYLMRGKTAHQRFSPKRHGFTYGVTLVDIDVERLAEANAVSRVFSINAANFVSLDTQRKGMKLGQSLKDWAIEKFEQSGLDTSRCRIRLITFPKTQFFSFSPISIWLLLDEEQNMRGLIYDVHNTFGEQHAYIAHPPANEDQHALPKRFHVSPFFDISGQYRFTVKHSIEGFNLLIENINEGERAHTASLILARHSASTKAFLSYLIKSPFAGPGVLLAIHWEAFRLFMKGMKYRSKPPVPEQDFSTNKDLSVQFSEKGS